MSSTSEVVSIRVLDREYTVGCEPGERDSLLTAAKLLDSKMREIRGNNRMAALDRVAVLAALNLAHDLQQSRDEHASRDRELSRTLTDLHRRLDDLFDTPAR
ncbi:cell division protein ZapA [Lysobacter sp. LF1]|uniref:Cell division protein ZapA n=1 Tax=Lysobacter stagni TaxID=3045172 RepID=A0ABT6XBL6_9GAMM|nr:cell division protein ZapA [Lysobacter sp. LF1]MDI9237535.1 cell division protein ZapA [Lysobacter sp. LF1]